jgi:hypothetical protein
MSADQNDAKEADVGVEDSKMEEGIDESSSSIQESSAQKQIPLPPTATTTKQSSSSASSASATANELLKCLAETSQHLRCMQAVDNALYLQLNSALDIMQMIQVQYSSLFLSLSCSDILLYGLIFQIIYLQLTASTSSSAKGHHISPGHEKDLVCIEDLCNSIKTYTNQVKMLSDVYMSTHWS